MGTYTWTITPNDIDREIKVWEERGSGKLKNGWDFVAINYDPEQIINVLKYAKEINKSVLITCSNLFWKAEIINDKNDCSMWGPPMSHGTNDNNNNKITTNDGNSTTNDNNNSTTNGGDIAINDNNSITINGGNTTTNNNTSTDIGNTTTDDNKNYYSQSRWRAER